MANRLSQAIKAKSKKPTKAAINARATVISEDIFAGRTFVQPSSDIQELPKGDNRYRVSHSVKFYIVQLMGTWLHVSESAQRSVKYNNRLKWVRFENRDYELRSKNDFKAFIGRFIQGGCYAYIGSKAVYTQKELNKIEHQDFIYLSSSSALLIFNKLREAQS